MSYHLRVERLERELRRAGEGPGRHANQGGHRTTAPERRAVSRIRVHLSDRPTQRQLRREMLQLSDADSDAVTRAVLAAASGDVPLSADVERAVQQGAGHPPVR
jgi:hypothetical protein